MIQLITDRTKSDVLLKTEKGYYSAADLNRVERAVEELYRLAKSVDVPDVPRVKTDWELPGAFSAAQWPTVSQMRRYLGNVSRLCEAVEIATNLPSSMEFLSWEGANQIESALLAVHTRIQNILYALKYSGEIFAGEENGL